MLKVKKEKWEKFRVNFAEYGFELKDGESAYIRKFHQDVECPNDFFKLQVWLDNREITIETSNSRYSGFATDGEELDVLYDLIMNGYIEKSVNE